MIEHMVRALFRHERAAFVRSTRADDSESRSASDLNASDADAAGSAMDEYSLAGPAASALKQCSIRSPVGNAQRGALSERCLGGQWMDARLFTKGELRADSRDRAAGVHAIADFKTLHVRSDGFDDAAGVCARRIRQVRLAGIYAGSDVCINRIHAHRLHPNDNLPRIRFRIGYVLKFQVLRSTKLADTNRSHRLVLPLLMEPMIISSESERRTAISDRYCFIYTCAPMHFLYSVLRIVVIDLVLSGDNAVVIGMAAHRLPLPQRKKAIVIGGGAAIVLRIALTAIAALLLQIPGLQLIGGLLLIWIAFKLLKAEEE